MTEIIGALIVGVILLVIPPLAKYIRRKYRECRSNRKEKKEREKKEKLSKLNESWESDRTSLQGAVIPLLQFNSIGRYGNTASECNKLAKDLEIWVQSIQRPEFTAMRDKLQAYAAKRKLINKTTSQGELVQLFLKRVEPNKSEPFALREEIEELLRSTSNPPYTEKDL
jgi:hypothetical protein